MFSSYPSPLAHFLLSIFLFTVSQLLTAATYLFPHATGLLFGRPLLKLMFGAAFRLTMVGWTILTKRWAVFFLVLACVNEVMWRFFTTETWIASKMMLSMPLTVDFALMQTSLLKRTWDGDDNPFAPERKD